MTGPPAGGTLSGLEAWRLGKNRMSGADRHSDQASRYGAGDGGGGRCDAVQIKPEGVRTRGNALNDAGYKGRNVGDGEDDDRGRKRWRRSKDAERAGTAKEQDYAENSQQLMNDSKGRMQELARKDHAET